MPERRDSNARNFISAASLLNQMLWLKCGTAATKKDKGINGLTAILHGWKMRRFAPFPAAFRRVNRQYCAEVFWLAVPRHELFSRASFVARKAQG